MKKLIKFENFTEVPLSDVGNNWSAEYHNYKKEGMFPYVRKSGKLEKVDINKTIPSDSIYMKPGDADQFNILSIKIFELKQQQEEILQKSQDTNKD